jgi:hypothetical protein
MGWRKGEQKRDAAGRAMNDETARVQRVIGLRALLRIVIYEMRDVSFGEKWSMIWSKDGAVDRLAMRGRNGVAAGIISPVGHFADAGELLKYILKCFIYRLPDIDQIPI